MSFLCKSFYHGLFFFCVLPLINAQSSPLLEEEQRYTEVSAADGHQLSDFSTFKYFERCGCVKRAIKWKRSRTCKAIITDLEVELRQILRDTVATDLRRAKIYRDLYTISNYRKYPDPTLLDSSVLQFQMRVKRLQIPENQNRYRTH